MWSPITGNWKRKKCHLVQQIPSQSTQWASFELHSVLTETCWPKFSYLSPQSPLVSNGCFQLDNVPSDALICPQNICRKCVMLSSQRGPRSLWKVSSIWLSQCYKVFKVVWEVIFYPVVQGKSLVLMYSFHNVNKCHVKNTTNNKLTLLQVLFVRQKSI